MKKRVYRKWFFVSVKQLLILTILFLFLVVGFGRPQFSRASSNITVTTFEDVKKSNDNECSLREAIIAANQDMPSGNRQKECAAGNGADIINLPPGSYLLSRTDNGNEDSAQTGDLDVNGDLVFNVEDGGVATIDGNGITDRIVHVLDGDVEINNVTLQNGNVPGDGGALFNSGTLTLTNVSLIGSMAAGAGGGLYNEGTLTAKDVMISGNHANGGSGGGLFNQGTITAKAVTISGNSANSGSGGGIYTAGGSASFTNSTISENFASETGSGLYAAASLELNSVTVVGDMQDLDDIVVAGNALTLKNSILAGECSGELTSEGYNLIQFPSADCNLTGNLTGNILGEDPLLESLGDNGGNTLTHALQLNSPAVDAGNPGGCLDQNDDLLSSDQRGFPRHRGISCDIGAFELQDPPQTGQILEVNTADDNDDEICGYEHCSLREVLNLANTSPLSNTVTFNIQGSAIISPQVPLPAITSPIFINGTTQPGGPVVLDGSGAGTGANGLEITAGYSTVKGIQIINFAGHGIRITENGNNQIEGNVISGNGGSGISIAGSGNKILGNTIYENDENGIVIDSGIENKILGNRTYDNGGLSIDLDNDGRTENDIEDLDAGANQEQNFPTLFWAILAKNDAEMEVLQIAGRLNSFPEKKVYTLELFASPTCNLYGGGDQTVLGSQQVETDEMGNVYFLADELPAVPENYFVNATATDQDGNSSELSDCISVGPGNTSWPLALRLDGETDDGRAVNVSPMVKEQFLDLPDQSRWYKFRVQPGSEIIVTLTDLPANYNLTIYKDIAQTYLDMASPSPQELPLLDAEFAADAFAPEVFSPEVFSPEVFSPEVFSPEVFSPEVFSPEVFSPEVFSPEVFSPEVFSPEVFSADAYSPEVFSPEVFSPEVFSPEVFSPEVFSPEVFSPEVFSPEVFSSAQVRSLLGVSAFRGTASEGIRLHAWNNTGDFYIRVRGVNGVFNARDPFHLEVTVLPSHCDDINLNPDPMPGLEILQPSAGNFKTLILTDMGRMTDSTDELNTLSNRLATFASLAEVDGVIVDVGADALVAAANAQANEFPACPYAKNIVADTIKKIIDGYWELNPTLEYIVLVGDDNVIPFYRYPDRAGLANENNYKPPLLDGSSSQASLRLGYVLGQDFYGSQMDVAFKGSEIHIPEMAVGRLVETAVEATTVLDAYLATNGGVTPLTTPPLVTGYDFLEDVALAVKDELEAGTGEVADTLIAPQAAAPTDPASWTATDLRNQLLNNGRHDLIFLAGHFSAGGALAADYQTRMTATEVAELPSTIDWKNVIGFSAGCHAGYNLVDEHGVPIVTEITDWPQAFARKGALLVSGSGYQYGDTDFLEYSERLYLNFSQQLRSGSGPVSVGEALVKAKQQYLAETPQMRGIHEKVLLEATIFGLPMLSVDFPGRFDSEGLDPAIKNPLAASSDPGNKLGLVTANLPLTPTLTSHWVDIQNITEGITETAFYYSGSNGVLTNPLEPALPLEIRNVSLPGTHLRGVGFRGGSYADMEDILAFTGAPTTEIRGSHVAFQTEAFYPVQFWQTNYFDQLAHPDGNGETYLAVTPAQFKSKELGSQVGTMRSFSELNFRLYYSNNTTTYTDENDVDSIPALSAPPTIVNINAEPNDSGTHVNFDVNVTGNPAAGIQEAWVVYTAVSGPFAGQWQPLDLTQDGLNATLWEGSLDLQGTNPLDIRYIVQAVNGVGLVALAANGGAFYIPTVGELVTDPTAIEITTVDPVNEGAYGTSVNVTARLTSEGQAIENQLVTFSLGSGSRLGMTDESGDATATLSVVGLPVEEAYQLQASFAGADSLAASSTSVLFTITKQDTTLTLDPMAGEGLADDEELITAILADSDGRFLGEKTVLFVISPASGTGDPFYRSVITDFAGRAVLGDVPLSHGGYSVNVHFGSEVLIDTGDIVNLVDDYYNSSSVLGTLTILNRAPQAEPDAYQVDENDVLVVAAPGVLDNDFDEDGDPLTAVLTEGPNYGMLALNSDGSFIYSPNLGYDGPDSFWYVASDGELNSTAVKVSITVNNVNDPPDCGFATVDPPVIWSTNKEFHLVSVADVFDPDGDAIDISVYAIFQDEPVGKGKFAPDAYLNDGVTVSVRAERDGNGDGRVYHLLFTADDGHGGTCSGDARVAIVPHDQSDIGAVDGGPLYDSTQR